MYQACFQRAALLLAMLAFAGCNQRVDAPQVGVYRAVLRLPGGDTPFGFEVAQEVTIPALRTQEAGDLRAWMMRRVAR